MFLLGFWYNFSCHNPQSTQHFHTISTYFSFITKSQLYHIYIFCEYKIEKNRNDNFVIKEKKTMKAENKKAVLYLILAILGGLALYYFVRWVYSCDGIKPRYDLNVPNLSLPHLPGLPSIPKVHLPGLPPVHIPKIGLPHINLPGVNDLQPYTKPGKKEVFFYQPPNTLAQVKYRMVEAQKFGAIPATFLALQEAYMQGASWCMSGLITGDDANVYSVVSTDSIASGSCPSGVEGVNKFPISPINASGYFIYGVKPVQGTTLSIGVLPFNSDVWSMYDYVSQPPPSSTPPPVVTQQPPQTTDQPLFTPTNYQEVFFIQSNDSVVDPALIQGYCSNVGAVPATFAQLQTMQQYGARWTNPGVVGDKTDFYYYPSSGGKIVSTDLNPKNNLAGYLCYGTKPDSPTQAGKITVGVPFNIETTQWSVNDQQLQSLGPVPTTTYQPDPNYKPPAQTPPYPYNVYPSNKTEVFYYKGDGPSSQAMAENGDACLGISSGNATISTIDRLTSEQTYGANWCNPGIVWNDYNNGYFPISDPSASCGSVGINKVPSGGDISTFGYVCDGLKPPKGTKGVLPFDSTRWSYYDEPGTWPPSTDASVNEVFRITRGQFSANPSNLQQNCTLMGAVPATLAQLQATQAAGASWVESGYVIDGAPNTGYYPQANGVQSVTTSQETITGYLCYGKKSSQPIPMYQGLNSVTDFNENTGQWSMYSTS